MKLVGIDSGSTTTKGVLIQDGAVLAKKLITTKGNPREAMSIVLDELGYDGESMLLTATGYGRNLIEADYVITEITCHAEGVKRLAPDIVQMIDIGGQDCKAIKMNSKGNVLDFNMNDKCAAGTGRFIDVMMGILGEDINHMDQFVAAATAVKINSMCTVFAESEVIGLIAQGHPREDIALGVLHSIISRVSNQFAKIRPKRDDALFLSGGLSQSVIIRELLSEYTKVDVRSHPDAQFAGAIGAAYLGVEKYAKEK